MRKEGQSQDVGAQRNGYVVEFETHVEAAVKLLSPPLATGGHYCGTIVYGLFPRVGEMARASGEQ